MPFSRDYFAARERFCHAASRLGWEVESHAVEAKGPAGQTLTVDVAMSPGAAESTLVVSSGLHGVEGMFGSAVQCAWLERRPAHPGARQVLIHALNPYGYTWGRRCDEHNIDPNRNFLSPGTTYRGCHPAYRRLDDWLNPRRPHHHWGHFPLVREYWRTGRHSLKEAIAQGQYDYPRGLFYGGAGASTTMKLVDANLGRWLGGSRHVIHMDFHTGLGPWAGCKLLIDDDYPDRDVAWLRRCFGADQVERSLAQGVAYQTRGDLGRWCRDRFPGVHYHYCCAEFGTYPALQVISGLRAENQAHHYGDSRSARYQSAKAQLRELFCPASLTWRRRTVRHSLALLGRALHAEWPAPQNASLSLASAVEPVFARDVLANASGW